MNFRSCFRCERFVFAALHCLVFAFCYWSAFQLRFDGSVPAHMGRLLWLTLPAILLAKLLIFGVLDSLTSGFFVTFADLVSLGRTSMIAMLVIVAGDFFLFPLLQIPRSVVAVDAGLSILLIGMMRSWGRFVQEHVQPTLRGGTRRRALIIGIGTGGERLVQQLRGQPSLSFSLVGFLSDEQRFQGHRVSGLPCLGGTSDVVQVAQRFEVRHLLVFSDALAGDHLRRLMQQCRMNQIEIKMIPSVTDILEGRFQMRMRDVDIHDLLNRPPVEFGTADVQAMIADRCVLVTGAGGSIGSEICRQVAHCQPRTLVLVERAENSLFRIEQELLRSSESFRLVACMADITDDERMQSIFSRFCPDIVFHAAAHKHVPLMERNPGQAVSNNVLGTKAVADLCVQHDVHRFVLISTDKSVNPSSVMGATKHLAERYVHALAQSGVSTKFMSVRFGNVMGSDGSVIGIFQQQIRQGGPITITHPDMERYFMTIPEASQLVLQAAAMGAGGETYVLDMGQPIKIVDLARDLIRLSGHSLDEIRIEFMGLRPGEKLTEQLHNEQEMLLETAHPRISASYRPFVAEAPELMIARLQACIHQSPDEVRSVLGDLIPEYTAVAIACDELQCVGVDALEEEAVARTEHVTL